MRPGETFGQFRTGSGSEGKVSNCLYSVASLPLLALLGWVGMASTYPISVADRQFSACGQQGNIFMYTERQAYSCTSMLQRVNAVDAAAMPEFLAFASPLPCAVLLVAAGAYNVSHSVSAPHLHLRRVGPSLGTAFAEDHTADVFRILTASPNRSS